MVLAGKGYRPHQGFDRAQEEAATEQKMDDYFFEYIKNTSKIHQTSLILGSPQGSKPPAPDASTPPDGPPPLLLLFKICMLIFFI